MLFAKTYTALELKILPNFKQSVLNGIFKIYQIIQILIPLCCVLHAVRCKKYRLYFYFWPVFAMQNDVYGISGAQYDAHSTVYSA